MKVKISQRSIYHKIAEIEIDVPNEVSFPNIREWIVDNEDTWVDKIDHKISETEFESGNGMDDGAWTDQDSESEWRYDAMFETVLGKMQSGGHL